MSPEKILLGRVCTLVIRKNLRIVHIVNKS